jgi:predicted nucleic acid-binding protein
MRLFLDSSALAKRYVAERGTDQVVNCCREADEIVLSVVCAPELISAFQRLYRERRLSSRQYRALKKDLAADLAQATIVRLTEAVLSKTIETLERTTARTLDAIHVASAFETSCDIFLSADRRQCEAARKMGLRVEELPF